MRTEQSSGRKLSHYDNLDVLRGVAILLVLVAHARPGARGIGDGTGVTGVVLFFALSGFLITSLLLADLSAYGRVRYARFYWHRVLRLYPPLFIVLAVYLVLSAMLKIFDQSRPYAAALVGATYTSDLPWTTPLVYAHAIGSLWSLSVEEQFYLIWPLLISLCFRAGRLGLLLCIALVFAEVCAAGVQLTNINAEQAYYLPSSWAICLIIGSISAVWTREIRNWLAGRTLFKFSLSFMSVVVLLYSICRPDVAATFYTYWLIAPCVAVSTSVLIHSSYLWSMGSHSPLKLISWLGKISYAAYLWNLVVVYVFLSYTKSVGIVSVGSIVVTIALAAASWWLIESRVAKWRRSKEGRPQFNLPV